MMEKIITRDLVVTENDVSQLICGLCSYKENIERLKYRTFYIDREIMQLNNLINRLRKVALDIEDEYENKE